jgi:hypothetical protein
MHAGSDSPFYITFRLSDVMAMIDNREHAASPYGKQADFFVTTHAPLNNAA